MATNYMLFEDQIVYSNYKVTPDTSVFIVTQEVDNNTIYTLQCWESYSGNLFTSNAHCLSIKEAEVIYLLNVVCCYILEHNLEYDILVS